MQIKLDKYYEKCVFICFSEQNENIFTNKLNYINLLDNNFLFSTKIFKTF